MFMKRPKFIVTINYITLLTYNLVDLVFINSESNKISNVFANSLLKHF